jgi:molybdopterin-binding protein
VRSIIGGLFPWGALAVRPTGHKLRNEASVSNKRFAKSDRVLERRAATAAGWYDGRKRTFGREGAHMKLSARNILKGKVASIAEGVVNNEVVIELAGGDTVVSIITKNASQSLGLKVGEEVYAVIKASNVMVGVDR